MEYIEGLWRGGTQACLLESDVFVTTSPSAWKQPAAPGKALAEPASGHAPPTTAVQNEIQEIINLWKSMKIFETTRQFIQF